MKQYVIYLFLVEGNYFKVYVIYKDTCVLPACRRRIYFIKSIICLVNMALIIWSYFSVCVKKEWRQSQYIGEKEKKNKNL